MPLIDQVYKVCDELVKLHIFGIHFKIIILYEMTKNIHNKLKQLMITIFINRNFRFVINFLNLLKPKTGV